MYLKNEIIIILKIKNILLSVTGVIFIFVSTWLYWDNKLSEYPESITEPYIWVILGVIFLLTAWISKREINNAVFLSRIFEGDLDGWLSYSDLAQLLNEPEIIFEYEIYLLRYVYMKRFEIVTVNGVEQIMLESRISACRCRSCGGTIEKRMYFNGTCPYCGSSDLFAGVLTANHFYTITHEVKDEKRNPDYYVSKYVWPVVGVAIVLLDIGLFIMLIMGCMSCGYYEHLNDNVIDMEEYGTKNEMISQIIFNNAIILMLTPMIISMSSKLISVYVAYKSSKYLAKQHKPFISLKKLPTVYDGKYGIRGITKALRRGYLINCCYELHDGKVALAISKKIVKDRCPYCGASIVGAVDNHYTCSYCGNRIMGVIKVK